MPCCSFFKCCDDLSCSNCTECHESLSKCLGSSETENFFFLTCCCTFPVSILLYSYVFLTQLACVVQKVSCDNCCGACCECCDPESYSFSSTGSHSVIVSQPSSREVSTTTTAGSTDEYNQAHKNYERERGGISFSERDNSDVRQMMHSSDSAWRRAGAQNFDRVADATNNLEDIELKIKHLGSNTYLEKERRDAESAWLQSTAEARRDAKEEKRERERNMSAS